MLLFFLGVMVVLYNVFGVALDVIDKGLVTGNRSHGEMWNYSTFGSEWTFTLDDAGVYYNLTNINNENHLRGMNYTTATEANGGSYFTIIDPGYYKASMVITAEANLANDVFAFAIVENFDIENHRDCYSRHWIDTNGPANIGISCFMTLEEGSRVNIQIENEQGNRDLLIHSINLNLLWVDT